MESQPQETNVYRGLRGAMPWWSVQVWGRLDEIGRGESHDSAYKHSIWSEMNSHADRVCI